MNDWCPALLHILSSIVEHPNEILSFHSRLSLNRATLTTSSHYLEIVSCDVGLRIKDAGQRYLFPFKWQPNRRQLPVLVFVPSSSLALGTLGGTSHIYEFASDQSYWNHINPYPPKSAHRRLQDFLTDRRLYVLCERKGESVCEVAYFGPGVERRTWTPAVCGLTDELHRKLSVGCCYNQAR